jgi:uncharacterized membrane protein
MTKVNIFLIITTLFTGIIAGLFFAWTVSVMNGLGKLPDREFILSMQSLNKEIQNPVFFIFLFGTVLLLPVAVFLSYKGASNISFWLILGAMLLYIIGVMIVTIAGNVPLNNILDGFSLQTSTPGEIASMRKKFEAPWNRLNLIRTLSGMLSFLLMLIGMVKK